GGGAAVRSRSSGGWLRQKRGEVLDDGRVESRIVVRRGERANGTGFHRKRLHAGNDVGLQLDEFRRRLRANARDPNRAARGVVVLEALQPHRVHIGGGEDLVGGGK